MDNSKSKVLIVDDNFKNLQLLGNILEKNNYHAETASNGEEALEWINTENFDLILLDIMMPGMDGFEVCSIIRQNDKFNDVPIIFLTAKTDKESTLKGFELNAQDFINKPFNTAELLARIKTHVELRDNKLKLKNINIWLEQKVNEKTRKLQEANSKLEETLAELKALDKMKSYFLNISSTEIRTPLTGIKGTLHLLKNDETTYAIRDLLNLLEKSVSKLEIFASKAILTTELTTKNYAMSSEIINLSELFLFCTLEFNEEISNRNIKIINDHTSFNISGDKDLIFKTFKFIIKNAIDHSENNSKIEFSTTQKENITICRFIDYGKGFSKKNIENIFSPYAFIESEYHKQNELSMYVIKLIMELHKGNIKVFNMKGAGACVELAFKNEN